MKDMKKAFYLLVTGVFVLALGKNAQAQIDQSDTRLLMPDGSPVGWNKLDSIKKEWGADRLRFRHNSEDDKNHVMRLYRLSDEELKSINEAYEQLERDRKAIIGRPAPLFTARDVNGKEWSLAQLKGKVVVLNFWFTSCPPCNVELPHLNEVVKKYAGKDVVFLALTFNDPGDVQAFMQKHEFAYSVIPMSKDIDARYKIKSWPSSFVIDKKGNVQLATGYEDAIGATLSASIDSALL